MASNPLDEKNQVIGRVLDHAREHFEPAHLDEILRFIELFYAPASPDDVIGQAPADLFARAVAIWQASEHRPPNEPIVDVFNTRKGEHGWSTPHTVLMIVIDDMPFLVDSITNGLAISNRIGIHVLYHPIIMVERDAKGRRQRTVGAVDFDEGGRTREGRESYMFIEIDAQRGKKALEHVRGLIRNVLADVRAAVTDWRAMMAKIDETVASLTVHPPPIPDSDVEESKQFLRWLSADRFTFIGFREYRFEGDPADSDFKPAPETSLGILRKPERQILRGPEGLTGISPEIRHFLTSPEPIIITKANVKTVVHRPVHLDYVGCKIFDAEGRTIGERRFVGLFTAQAYAESALDVPLLRKKVRNVQKRALFDPRSHAGKALTHILETFPRDELFQINEDGLLHTCLGILHLLERPRPRAFLRPDKFERFVSALVYVPRDNYNSSLRQAAADILCAAYNGEVSVYHAMLSEDVLARWHFIIRTTPGKVPKVDEDEINARIAEAAKSWTQRVKEVLLERYDEDEAIALHNRYADLFTIAYREDFTPKQAVLDIVKLEQLRDRGPCEFEAYRLDRDAESALRLKIYHPSKVIPLSECLPILENIGLKVVHENAYELEGSKKGCIHDFYLEDAGGKDIDLVSAKPRIEELLRRAWSGDIESDAFNELTIDPGLTWHQIVILRAYARYLRQLNIPFGVRFMARTLASNPTIAAMLYRLFDTQFDPALEGEAEREGALDSLKMDINEALEDVASLDQDRVLRNYLNVIEATLRTNYYQQSGENAGNGIDAGLALKIRTSDVEEAPRPKPFAEIFVYSPRVEGVHLRGGPIARGGLRWSDRREDFRTEILGLVKAQQVKNVVIVPVGAKGGFYPKRLPGPGNREAFQAEGKACYEVFVSSLLSVTDNLVDGAVKTPDGIIRRDGDDPYLVVAADKGTATLSDTANEIAQRHAFWLGDAFASGGSNGYDHKKMAITARGAWVSVQRHFREMGIDVQTDTTRVIGIGDMSGDVFGNGMLLSKALKLVAAFDHRHIFIDPDPDPAASWKERKRLFDLPRSSWTDYDESLISDGGGVWPRSVKSIDLTDQVRSLLGIESERVTPNELIRHILRAEVDLLWFGGIGSYVKAHDEAHTEVGDRANDATRVNADELRVKVVGEGGNLGMTQRGRIEFAHRGGRLNTDFIDNSGGVGCSDKEVNIKILFGELLQSGKITMEQRNKMLADMTDEVADIVLQDNYMQTGAMSMAEAKAAMARESHAGLIRTLEREGLLHRDIEFLPSEEQFSELALSQKGLCRPEIAVLMAYAKMSLKAILAPSPVMDDPVLFDELAWGFPQILVDRYTPELKQHRLRREIVATDLANSVINRGGLTFVYEVREETGLGVDQIISAFIVTRDVFRLTRIWPQIDALDYKVSDSIQTLMHLEIADFMKHQSIWFLRNCNRPLSIAKEVTQYADGVQKLMQEPESVLSPIALEGFRSQLGMYQEQGVPTELARRVAALESLGFACDIERVSDDTHRPVEEVGKAFFEVGNRLGFDWLRQTSEMISSDDHWDTLAARAVLDDLADQQRELTRAILEIEEGKSAHEAVEDWISNQEMTLIRVDRLLSDLRSSGSLTVAKLSFAARHIRSIISRADADGVMRPAAQ